MKYYINQIGTQDCGMTSLKMLLAAIHKNKNYLYYPIEDKDVHYNLLELKKIATKEGVELIIFKLENKNEFSSKIKTPCLVVLNRNNKNHLVLVKRIKKKKILLYDPEFGIYYENINDFINNWENICIECKKVSSTKYKIEKLNIVKVKDYIFPIVFQFCSLVSLILALSFIGEESFYISLILFIGYIIFEIVYKKILINKMKKIDFKFFEIIKNKDDFDLKYNSFNKLKTLLISLPIEFISLIISLILIITILGLNSLYNLIISALIIIINIIIKIFETKKINNQKKNILLLENNLCNQDKKTIHSSFVELNKKVYDYCSYLDIKKYIILFVIIIINIIYMYSTNNISINFLTYHFFIYSFINEQINALLAFDEKILIYKKERCTYQYFLNKANQKWYNLYMELDFNNDINIDLEEYYSKYLKLFQNTIDELGKKNNYICSITFVSKEKIHEINLNYRSIDRPTDVISFAFLDDKTEKIIGDIPIDLGEIYICYDVAKENAIKYGNTLNRELCFLFVHGLLHLFGYDHMTKKDEDIMFPLQEKILAR